jgi:hypothetical protein
MAQDSIARIRAFPPHRAVELDIARWEELIRSFEDLGSLRVIVSNGCAEPKTRFISFHTRRFP